MRDRVRLLLVASVGILVAGCHTDMWVQPQTLPYRESGMFADGQSARPLVPGTIARGYARLDEAYFTGQVGGKWLKDIPVPVTMELLKRGQERFNIYCSPCHSRIGDGQGMISHRGFDLRRPVGNYHSDRLRAMPAGHFYDVITNGYGAMFSYASRVEPADRWAIVAYIRALQLSQHATQADLGRTAPVARGPGGPPGIPTGATVPGAPNGNSTGAVRGIQVNPDTIEGGQTTPKTPALSNPTPAGGPTQ